MSEHTILFQNTAPLLDDMQNTEVGIIHHPTDDIGVELIMHSYFCLKYPVSMGSSQPAEHSRYLEISHVKASYTSSPNYMLVVLLFRLQASSRCCFTPFAQSIPFSRNFLPDTSRRHTNKGATYVPTVYATTLKPNTITARVV